MCEEIDESRMQGSIPPYIQDRINHHTPSKDFQAEVILAQFQKRID